MGVKGNNANADYSRVCVCDCDVNVQNRPRGLIKLIEVVATNTLRLSYSPTIHPTKTYQGPRNDEIK